MTENGNGNNCTNWTLAEDKPAMVRFLDKLRASGNVRASCDAADVPRSTVYYWHDKFVWFSKAWKDAKADACDILEAEAWRRAMKEDSDRLLMFLLKAHRRDVYGDVIEQKHSGTGEKGAVLFQFTGNIPEEGF